MRVSRRPCKRRWLNPEPLHQSMHQSMQALSRRWRHRSMRLSGQAILVRAAA